MSSDESPRFTAEESRLLFGTDSPSPAQPQVGAQPSLRDRVRSAVGRGGGLSRFAPVFVLLALMWIIEIVDAILPADLDLLGLQAWNPISLYGVITSPLLHAGFGHLLANTFPFLVLGLFIAAEGARRFWLVTAVTAVVAGVGAWLTTMPGTYIVGASGIVFGYFGYLAVRTWFTDDVLRKIIYFTIGFFIFITYGASLVFGMLPQANGVSWQGHLFGFIGGVLAAWLIHRRQGSRTTA
ncbi:MULTISPECIES: rhomboid family intramembrane serine protease [Brevibacterium]|uniref:Rhomboid family intramembrane serine protease n=1 Tax=Brevibacterium casei TaxID=33889 RepID=A0A7T4DH93_9MICO|nr:MULTISPECIES: rhomboid family intramembrane serine protease [Brevibacterium]QQB13025.1 rhomboid family intramembrane serine protease [Brevibacterium casei]